MVTNAIQKIRYSFSKAQMSFLIKIEPTMPSLIQLNYCIKIYNYLNRSSNNVLILVFHFPLKDIIPIPKFSSPSQFL